MDHDLEPPVELREQDFRLLPGSPGYQAGPDGKDLGADIDLVGPGEAYERWKQTPEYEQWLKDTGQFEPTPEKQAFVVLNTNGTEIRKHDTLADAVLGASDGDTIEIRGNGPFVTEPITISSALTIRAGDGFRPVIRLNPEFHARANLLVSDSPLVLEGLEFQRTAPEKYEVPWLSFVWGSKALHVANCRFLLRSGQITVCIHASQDICALRNCEFLCPQPLGNLSVWFDNLGSRQRVAIENCLLTGEVGIDWRDLELKEAFVRLAHNTFRFDKNALGCNLVGQAAPELNGLQEHARFAHVEASGNVFATDPVFSFDQYQPVKTLPPLEAQEFVARMLGWQGERNLYAVAHDFLRLTVNGEFSEPPEGIKSVAGWRRFWGTPEADSIEGRVLFQGGNLAARLQDSPETLTPEDFRLRPDSAGYQASPDGKDLGADIDFVGPGAAYERWKQTPDYEQWLKETRQVK
jgi:hypothetical protein